MILYLDSNPLIYSIAAKPRFREPTLRWLDWHAAQPDATIVTSQLTVLESLVGVIKRNDAALRSELGRVLDAMMVLDVDSVIAERAAAIRASSQHRTPDAIHLATALTCGADLFLTADRRLKAFPDLRVADVLRDDPATFFSRT